MARPAGMSPARAALEAARSGKPLSMPAPAAATAPAPKPVQPVPEPDSGVPPWMDEGPPDEFSARPGSAPAQKKTESAAVELKEPVSATAPVEPPPLARAPREVAPVPALNWDGDWPTLAAKLPLRGVVHQLAQQSELLECEPHGEGTAFLLRIPVDTLRSAGAVDKLATALSEHFGKPVRVNTEIGAVARTANAAAVAEREARQREAEESMHNDPFVQTLMREFGASFVPGSIRPV